MIEAISKNKQVGLGYLLSTVRQQSSNSPLGIQAIKEPLVDRLFRETSV